MILFSLWYIYNKKQAEWLQPQRAFINRQSLTHFYCYGYKLRSDVHNIGGCFLEHHFPDTEWFCIVSQGQQQQLISQFLLQISRITYVCYWEECLHIVKAELLFLLSRDFVSPAKWEEEEDGVGSTCKLLSRRETMPVNFHAFTLVSSRDRVKVAVECACLLGRELCLVGNCYHHQQVTMNTYFPAQMLIHKNSNPNLLPFYCDSLKRV
jgi:hypothetical protein